LLFSVHASLAAIARYFPANSPGVSWWENKEVFMRSLTFIAAATAIGGMAAPAAAQYYSPSYPQQQQQQQQPVPQPAPGQPGYGYYPPQQTYPYPGQTYPQQGYAFPGQQGGIDGIIGQLLGNRYAGNERTLITQCATAASSQAARQYRPRYQQPYGQAYGYNQQSPGYARVTAITNVERRNNNGLRVYGLMNSGMNSYQGYNQPPYGNAYGHNQNAYAQADLSFRCNVDYRGQVSNVRLTRVNNRRY
jgi:hypothetical protein